MTIKVLLVDDHWEVRERRRVLPMQAPDIELVDEAADGAEALAVLERFPAEVVVMDLNLPEISGIETARRLLADRTNTRVIIIRRLQRSSGNESGFRMAQFRGAPIYKDRVSVLLVC